MNHCILPICYCINRISDFITDKSSICNEITQLCNRLGSIIERNRNHNIEAIFEGKTLDISQNIIECTLSENDFWMIGAISCGDRSEENTKIVIYFRDCSHSRTWVVRHCFLVNGDRWRKSMNFFDTCIIPSFSYDHSCIRRKTLKIFLLSYRVNGIEGKG